MLNLDIDSNLLINRQVFEQLACLILSGHLQRGDKLPSTRSLAKSHGISRNVINMAYDHLSMEGYIEIKRGSGAIVRGLKAPKEENRKSKKNKSKNNVVTLKSDAVDNRLSAFAKRCFVEEQTKSLKWGFTENEFEIDFRFGVPYLGESLQEHLRKAFSGATKRIDSYQLDYGDPRGDSRLRKTISDYLAISRSFHCQPDQIIVTHGAQQGFDLIARALLDRKDKVIMEDPRYLGFERIARLYQADVDHVPIDGHGLITDELPLNTRCKLIYVTPTHQFPTGVVLSYDRRQALLEYAEKKDCFILEDDYDSEYQFNGRPVAPLASSTSQRVIYCGSFSKLLSPALRVGFLVLPELLVGHIAKLKQYMDIGCNRIVQQALAELLTSGSFGKHLRKTKLRLERNRNVMLSGLRGKINEPFEVYGTQGGMHMVVKFNDRRRETFYSLREAANQVGVQIYSPHSFYVKKPEELHLIFGYGHLGEDEIREGVRRFVDTINC